MIFFVFCFFIMIISLSIANSSEYLRQSFRYFSLDMPHYAPVHLFQIHRMILRKTKMAYCISLHNNDALHNSMMISRCLDGNLWEPMGGLIAVSKCYRWVFFFLDETSLLGFLCWTHDLTEGILSLASTSYTTTYAFIMA